jgi:hypothetical protein
MYEGYLENDGLLVIIAFYGLYCGDVGAIARP